MNTLRGVVFSTASIGHGVTVVLIVLQMMDWEGTVTRFGNVTMTIPDDDAEAYKVGVEVEISSRR